MSIDIISSYSKPFITFEGEKKAKNVLNIMDFGFCQMGKLSPKKFQERPLGQGIFSPSNAIKGLGKRSNYVDEHEESLGSIFSTRLQNPECGIRPWFEFWLKIS